jgi:transcriptional regulator with XRE-family HTH domain
MGKDAARRRAISPEIAFGRVLRSIRHGNKVSQDDLGAKSGYHRTYIGQLERGEKSPSLRTLFNLAASLGVPLSTMVKSVERALRF